MHLLTAKGGATKEATRWVQLKRSYKRQKTSYLKALVGAWKAKALNPCSQNRWGM